MANAITPLQQALNALNVAIKPIFLGVRTPPWGGSVVRAFDCTLIRGTAKIHVPFYQGTAHKNPPTSADVVGCMLLDASALDSTFEEWCSDMGYDSDSRAAERTYHACIEQGKKAKALLGEHFDALRELEH
jgi:hypothetical protein